MGMVDSDGVVCFFAINLCLLGLNGLDFGFLWVGILDSNGVWVGFGLVGWIGVVDSGLFGCSCYWFA